MKTHSVSMYGIVLPQIRIEPSGRQQLRQRNHENIITSEVAREQRLLLPMYRL